MTPSWIINTEYCVYLYSGVTIQIDVICGMSRMIPQDMGRGNMINRERPHLWKSVVLEPCCLALGKEGYWQAKKGVTGWTNRKYYVSSR